MVSYMWEGTVCLRSLIRRTGYLWLLSQIILAALLLREEHPTFWLLPDLATTAVLIVLADNHELILSIGRSALSTNHTLAIL